MAEALLRCAVCLVIHTGVPPFVEKGRMSAVVDGMVDIILDEEKPLPKGARVVVEPDNALEPRLLGQVEQSEGHVLRIRVQRAVPRERRAAPRYAAAMALEFRRPNEASVTRARPLVEVAISGLAFEADTDLRQHDAVELTFTIPGDLRQTRAAGVVVRVAPGAEGRKRISVALDPDQNGARQALSRFSAAIQDSMFGGPPPGRQPRRRRYQRGAADADA